MLFVLSVILSILSAWAGYSGAKRKGREEGGWAALCFIMPFALLVLELLPSKIHSPSNMPYIPVWLRVLETITVYMVGLLLLIGFLASLRYWLLG